MTKVLNVLKALARQMQLCIAEVSAPQVLFGAIRICTRIKGEQSNMKFATKCLFALVVLTVTTQLALADSLNVTGPTSASLGLGEGNGQQALPINFNTSASQSGLSLDAVLSGFGGSQTVSWWLTDQIGAGTTGANVFASGTFAGPGTLAQNTNIFNGISLNAGSYFVVLSAIGQGNNSGWDFTGAPTVTSS